MAQVGPDQPAVHWQANWLKAMFMHVAPWLHGGGVIEHGWNGPTGTGAGVGAGTSAGVGAGTGAGVGAGTGAAVAQVGPEKPAAHAHENEVGLVLVHVAPFRHGLYSSHGIARAGAGVGVGAGTGRCWRRSTATDCLVGVDGGRTESTGERAVGEHVLAICIETGTPSSEACAVRGYVLACCVGLGYLSGSALLSSRAGGRVANRHGCVGALGTLADVAERLVNAWLVSWAIMKCKSTLVNWCA
eukprot:151898_1